MTSYVELGQFERDGFQVFPGIVDPSTRGEVVASWPLEAGAGSRQALNEPSVCDLATVGVLGQLAKALLGDSAKPVRGIFFDKTPNANWLVPWHQDVTIATKRQVNIDGYGPWSEKERIPHVQPPAGILEHMVALRVHIDDCLENNGPLMVIPGSHTLGKLSEGDIERRAVELPKVTLTCKAGDVIAMRPLILHASSKANSPHHRRVLHVENTSVFLPEPLEWYWS